MPLLYSVLFHKIYHSMKIRKIVALNNIRIVLNSDITKDETRNNSSEWIFFRNVRLHCFSLVLSWFYWLLWFCFFFFTVSKIITFQVLCLQKKKKDDMWKKLRKSEVFFFWTWKLKVIQSNHSYGRGFITGYSFPLSLHSFTDVFHLSKLNRFRKEKEETNKNNKDSITKFLLWTGYILKSKFMQRGNGSLGNRLLTKGSWWLRQSKSKAFFLFMCKDFKNRRRYKESW